MKKLLAIALSLCLIGSFAACGEAPSNSNNSSDAISTETSSEKSLLSSDETPVDSSSSAASDTSSETVGTASLGATVGSELAEITLPAAFLNGQTIDADEMKANGAVDVVKNEDGSITLKITKDQYDEMMTQIKSKVAELLNDLKNNEKYSFIKDIKYNDDFSDLTLMVNSEEYEGVMGGIAVMGVAVYAMMYQSIGAQENHVVVHVIDADSGEEIDTQQYPKE